MTLEAAAIPPQTGLRAEYDDPDFRSGARPGFQIDPAPGRLVTMLWTMCNPRPVLPRSRRVVKKGSNTWRLTSGFMPQPSSENSTSTLCLPDACAAIWTDPRAPSGKACTAELITRLVSTGRKARDSCSSRDRARIRR